MSQQDTILEKAISQIGTMQNSQGGVVYSDEYGLINQAWCAMFVWWVFKECGYSDYLGVTTASCKQLYKTFSSKGALYNTAEAGDVALFCWDGSGVAQHCGIVESVSDTSVTTIDGNTRASGYERNCVARKTRSLDTVVGFCRPSYTDTVTTATSTEEESTLPETYTTDPNLDYQYVRVVQLPTITDRATLYDAIVTILKSYGLIDASIASQFSTMDSKFNTSYSNTIINANHRYFILFKVNGDNHWGYSILTSDVEIARVSVTASLFGGIGYKVYGTEQGSYMGMHLYTFNSYEVDENNMFFSTYDTLGLNYIGGYNRHISQGGTAKPTGTTFVTQFWFSNSYWQTILYPYGFDYTAKLDLDAYAITTPVPDVNPIPQEGLKMIATFWRNFSKRNNSTLQPTNGTDITVTLLQDSSLIRPKLRIKSSVTDYNYFSLLGRYYYIEDYKVCKGNIIEVYGLIDPMATYKDEILGTTAFVERAESTFDEYLVDSAVSTKNLTTSSFRPSNLTLFSSSGCYIVGVTRIAGGTFTLTRGLVHYVLTANELAGLYQFINATDDTVATKFISTFSNLIDAISEVRYIPIPYSDVIAEVSGTADSNVIILDVDTEVNGYMITQSLPMRVVDTITLSDLIPDDFRRCEPYTTARLFIPFYGFVDLPLMDARDTLQLQVDYDVCTGECFVEVFASEDTQEACLVSVCYNASVPIVFAHTHDNSINVLPNVLSTMGSAMALMGGDFMGALGISYGIIGTLSSAYSNVTTTKGSVGGMGMYRETEFYVQVNVANTVDVDETVIGKPLMTSVLLSSLTGFCKCKEAHVACVGTPSLRSQIESTMNQGFFIE